MEKIEHIGIAVKDLEVSNKLFASLFGKEHYKEEEVASEGVKTSFFPLRELYTESCCIRIQCRVGYSPKIRVWFLCF